MMPPLSSFVRIRPSSPKEKSWVGLPLCAEGTAASKNVVDGAFRIRYTCCWGKPLGLGGGFGGSGGGGGDKCRRLQQRSVARCCAAIGAAACFGPRLLRFDAAGAADDAGVADA